MSKFIILHTTQMNVLRYILINQIFITNFRFINENYYVLNYRFVKNVEDEDWTVNLMIHARLADEIEEQKRKLFKFFSRKN